MTAAIAVLGAGVTPPPPQPAQQINVDPVTVSVTAFGGATAIARYRLLNDGTVQDQDNIVLGTWNTSPGTVGSFEVRATLQSGSVSGTFGTWQNLGVSRAWSVTAPASATSFGDMLIEIRDAASPFTVRDSATISLFAESN